MLLALPEKWTAAAGRRLFDTIWKGRYNGKTGDRLPNDSAFLTDIMKENEITKRRGICPDGGHERKDGYGRTDHAGERASD